MGLFVRKVHPRLSRVGCYWTCRLFSGCNRVKFPRKCLYLITCKVKVTKEIGTPAFLLRLTRVCSQLGFQLFTDKSLTVKHYFLLSSPVKTPCALGTKYQYFFWTRLPALITLCYMRYCPPWRAQFKMLTDGERQHNNIESIQRQKPQVSVGRQQSNSLPVWWIFSSFLTQQHDADVTKPLPPVPVALNCGVFTLGRVEWSEPLH